MGMAGLMVFIKNVVGRAQENTPLRLVFIENGAGRAQDHAPTNLLLTS